MKDLIDNCSKNYLIIKDYPLEVPPESKFIELYKGFRQGLSSVPDNLIADEYSSFHKLHQECLKIYGHEPNSYFTIEGKSGSGTERHFDGCDVIHWQCHGQSEWTLESDGETEVVVLNAGDIIWFKRGVHHTVMNLTDKFSVIFMAMENKYGV